jgi:Tfp pilus assembly protein PilN
MLTVNLLPQEYKKELNQKIVLSVVKNIAGLIFTAVIFIAIILLLAKNVSINNFNGAVEQATLLTKEYGGFNQEIRQINDQITTAYQIQ